jgi:hypothetical protein
MSLTQIGETAEAGSSDRQSTTTIATLITRADIVTEGNTTVSDSLSTGLSFAERDGTKISTTIDVDELRSTSTIGAARTPSIIDQTTVGDGVQWT